MAEGHAGGKGRKKGGIGGEGRLERGRGKGGDEVMKRGEREGALERRYFEIVMERWQWKEWKEERGASEEWRGVW